MRSMGGVIAGWPVLSYNASGPFGIDTGLVAGCLQVGDALLEVRVIENPNRAWVAANGSVSAI